MTPSALNPLVNVYKDREAMYKAVFAELRTTMIKHAFRNPGSRGILEFMATIMAIEAALAFRSGRLRNAGSIHETLR
jgi:hypothetical protein